MPTTETRQPEFQPGQRIEIQDRDRDSDRYPQATVVRAVTRGEFLFDQSRDPGYLVRYDNGGIVWKRESDVLTLRNPDSRIVERAVAELVTDGWEDAESLSPEDLRQIAVVVLRAAEQFAARQVEQEFAEHLLYAAELEAYERLVREAPEVEGLQAAIETFERSLAMRALMLADAVSRTHKTAQS